MSATPLLQRYGGRDLDVLTAEERRRFAGADPAPGVSAQLAWQLLYRIEPDLYARLVAGERLHPGILAWLPGRVGRCVEVGAGTGRLTAELLPRCRELVAVEPAAPLREMLALLGARAVDGFFDAIPVADGWADLVVTCSALTADPPYGGEPGVDEMERVTAPGGTVVVVWPPRDRLWLSRRGYRYVSFPGEMAVEFAGLEEAVELCRIFYPHAAGEVARRGSPKVPYGLLGVNPPRDLVWRRKPA